MLPQAGTYNVSTDYTILTAAGGLVGTFDSVSSNLAFLTPTLTYDANNVFLNLARNAVTFSAVANTPNQRAVAALLTQLQNTNPVAIQDILNQLLPLTTFGAQQAFDNLSGVQHTHSNVLMLGANRQFLQLLFDRLGFNPTSSLAFNPSDGPLLAYQGADWAALTSSYFGGSQADFGTQRGVWLQGIGGVGDIDATYNASGADYNTKGFAFGVDTDWRNMVVGFAGSFINSDADTFGGNTEVDSYQFAAYGGWEHDDYYVSTNVGFGYHAAEASRAVIVGATTSTASSDYDATTVSASVVVGKDIPLQLATTLTPYAGIAFNHLDRDSFIEAGAGTANLSVTDNEEDSLRTRFGLRLSHAITNADGSQLTPYAYGGYVREHLDDTSTLTAGFSAVPTSTFTVSGVERDRNRAEVGAGLTGKLNDNTTFNIGYDGDIAGSDDHHSFSAAVKVVW